MFAKTIDLLTSASISQKWASSATDVKPQQSRAIKTEKIIIMQMHIYQHKQAELFLSSNISNVVNHLRSMSSTTLHTIDQLDDSTLVRLDDRLFDIKELTQFFKNDIKKHGLALTDKSSIRIRTGKIVEVTTDKTHTLRNLLIDKIYDGQNTFAYDDYAHDYTKTQFRTATRALQSKIDCVINSHRKPYYRHDSLVYKITKKSPTNHQKITYLTQPVISELSMA